MKHAKLMTALFAVLVSISLLQTVKADQWDKDTIFTIKESIQLPNKVLEPGTYVMRLVLSPADRHVVQVWDKDRMHLLTTVLAIPNYRLEPTGKSVFAFWETPEGQPKALRAWFYPGDTTGQEFAYPKGMSTTIAAYNRTAVPTTSSSSDEEFKTASVESIDQSGKQLDLDKNAYTPPEPARIAAAPVPEPPPVIAQLEPPRTTVEPVPIPSQEAPTELPHTASSLPLIGLIGLASLLAFGLTSRTKSRQ